LFGLYRYALATMVAVGHLRPSLGPFLGAYAVFGFYVLSGYLMTLVLTRTYAPSAQGTARFYGNRALRIFPPFWLALVFAAGLAWYAPETTRSLHPAIVLPVTTAGWLGNLSLIGVPVEAPIRLVPPSWSLRVEFFFYLVMPLGLARRPRAAAVWFFASVAYTVWLVASGAPVSDRYYPIAAASLPFSAGSLLYHVRERVRESEARILALIGVGAFSVLAVGASRLWSDPLATGFYASLSCAAAATVGLARLPRPGVPSWLARIDRFAGDLSYPIFLVHWPAAIAVHLLFGEAGGRHPLVFAAAVAAGVNAAAWMLHTAVEVPLARLRDRVRPG
jgi:peptidoglycan/LPS O-acetylase OafA/YrhL